MNSLYEDLPLIYGSGEKLNDNGRNWRKTKLRTEAVSRAFSNESKYWRARSELMLQCGSVLYFAENQEGEKRLIRANFCRDRMCPGCQRRRSLVIFHQVKATCESAQQAHPTLKYLLLTLTVPNVPAEQLSDEIKHMMASFKRLMLRKEVKTGIKGFFRALEVTCNLEREDYHPHFHVLLAVPSNYFAKNYIAQSRWLELWQEATRYPHITQVDVRTIKANPKRPESSEIESGVAEVAKYATKPSNYTVKLPDGNYYALPKPVMDLSLALRSKRLIGFGGILKEHHDRLKLDDVDSAGIDLVNTGGESELINALMVKVFRWNVGLRQYVN